MPAYVPPQGQSKAVNLGTGITGAQYGSDYALIEWHEGKWTLQVSGSTTSDNLSEAKIIVQYLHTHFLPMTSGVLGATLTGDCQHTSLQWAFGKVVYECSDLHSALQAVKLAVSMRNIKTGLAAP